MVWNPMKNNTMRRRQKSQSPSSSSADSGSRGINTKSLFGTKHKRRMFRKDSAALTEASSMSSRSSTAGTEGAPWRVENIRQAPPRPEEWWERVGSSDSDAYETDESGNVNPKVVYSPRASGRRMKFRNCGLETWLRTREEWQQRTVETLPKRPSPAEHVQLVKGLTKASTQRTYELPRRMALSDLIIVYNDIWDGEGM